MIFCMMKSSCRYTRAAILHVLFFLLLLLLLADPACFFLYNEENEGF